MSNWIDAVISGVMGLVTGYFLNHVSHKQEVRRERRTALLECLADFYLPPSWRSGRVYEVSGKMRSAARLAGEREVKLLQRLEDANQTLDDLTIWVTPPEPGSGNLGSLARPAPPNQQLWWDEAHQQAETALEALRSHLVRKIR